MLYEVTKNIANGLFQVHQKLEELYVFIKPNTKTFQPSVCVCVSLCFCLAEKYYLYIYIHCNMNIIGSFWFSLLFIVFLLLLLLFSDTRLGKNGAAEVKRQAFFKNDKWTWDNLREHEPPVVPELHGDTDTQYFDVIDDEKDKVDNFATPRVSIG